jgi:uncharacterized protein (TIGR02246 family)
MSVRTGIAALLFCGLLGCRSGAFDADEEDDAAYRPANVEAAVQRMVAADNAGDVAALLDCYTEDALLCPADGSTYAGRDAIRAHLTDVFSKLALHLKATAVETSVGDEHWAWQRGEISGSITPKDGSPATAAHDRYLMILELGDEDDRWRIARVFWGPAEGIAAK